MIIDQLPEVSVVQNTDEIPVERGTTTYKSTLQKLKDFVASLLTKSDVGLGNVDNVRQYSAQNPPPYPVTSVNGETGAVTTPQNDSGTGYCKMPDGTLIQWGTASISGVDINRTWGQVYETARLDMGVTFPIQFISRPSLALQQSVSPAGWIETTEWTTTGIGAYYLVRPTIATGVSGVISWLAIGRWK